MKCFIYPAAKTCWHLWVSSLSFHTNPCWPYFWFIIVQSLPNFISTTLIQSNYFSWINRNSLLTSFLACLSLVYCMFSTAVKVVSASGFLVHFNQNPESVLLTGQHWTVWSLQSSFPVRPCSLLTLPPWPCCLKDCKHCCFGAFPCMCPVHGMLFP